MVVVGYPSTLPEELEEQQCVTNMEYKHGVGQTLSGASKDTREAVESAMRSLVDTLSKGSENKFNLIEGIIAEMGSEVWRASINLKNQKGTIKHSFLNSTTEVLKIATDLPLGDKPQWTDELKEFEGLFVWFPHVIITRPLHTYGRSAGTRRVDRYNPECAPVDLRSHRVHEPTVYGQTTQVQPNSGLHVDSGGLKAVRMSFVVL